MRNWYGQVRHSSRFWPSGKERVEGARETVRTLAQEGQKRSISVVGGWCAEFQSVECGVWVFGAEWCAEFGPFSCDNFSAALQSCLSLYMSRRSYHAYMN